MLDRTLPAHESAFLSGTGGTFVQAFCDPQLDPLFWRADLVNANSAWCGHIPFAHWVIGALLPRVFVELGTHTGVSYAAFCLAVQRERLDTRCYAVDTWEGDEQAGYYGEEVFTELRRHHDERFGAFSTLLRCTFDEAVEHFTDRSVDLLHIDGLHTYEAVRHDFETWQPKLSDRAIVLFHDTNVRQGDFGVWRLWEELRQSYPFFDFLHGHGLGVLGFGSQIPEKLAELFRIRERTALVTVRDRFAMLGERWEAEQREQAVLAQEQRERVRTEAAQSVRITSVENTLRQKETALAESLEAKNNASSALKRSEEALQRSEYARRRAEQAAASAETRNRELQTALQEAEQRLESESVRRAKASIAHSSEKAELESQLAAVSSQLEMSQSSLETSSLQVTQLSSQLAAFESSTLWRATWPVRRLSNRLPRSLRRTVRRGAKLAWWTGTLQLPRRYSEWRSVKRGLVPATQSTPGASAEGISANLPSTLGDHLIASRRGNAESAVTAVQQPTSEIKRITRSLLMARLHAFLASGETLDLPTNERPTVSILIVLYNGAELTFACLESLRECVRRQAVEVIILDNGSTDLTAALLARLRGAKVIRNSENMHYLRGVNRAAREAGGDYLLLLNNDAQLFPGTLDAAVATIQSGADIGAVGGRIMLPDGTLQEAGSIIWNDGTCTGFGRGREIADPEVMFRRDVDFCSAAFLLTHRWLFEYVGPFDEAYAPAYYEEVDYCVRLWRAGYRVVYDPDILVLHYEFGSSSSSAEALALQQRNFAVFRDRHADWLTTKYSPGDSNVLHARAAGSRSRRVLVIEDRVPHECFGAGYPRSREIIREIAAAGCTVSLFPIFHHPENWTEVRRTVGRTVEVALGHSGKTLGAFLASRAGFYDAILICRPHNMSVFLDAVEQHPGALGSAKLIYDAEALFSEREILRRELLQNPIPKDEADRLVTEEIGLARHADAVTSVSSKEAQLFRSKGIRDVRVLGYPGDPTPTPASFEERTDILFVGAVYGEDSPNVDSLHWFANRVLPELQSQLGTDIRLKVVGQTGAKSIAQMDGITCDFLGPVDDLAPVFDRAKLFVVPTRFSAGVPIKVFTSAGFGVPCVVTPLIAEQTGWEENRDFLVGSDPRSFALACASLLRDRELWEKIRAGALARFAEDCSRGHFRDAIRQVLSDILSLPDELANTTPVIIPGRGDYRTWITLFDTLSYLDRLVIAERIGKMSRPPTISVVVPAYNTPEHILRRCIESVQRQLYPYWELCIVDDASSQPHVARLCEAYARCDQRIHFRRRETNGHIAAATNSALEFASGEFVAFLDHDDLLAPHALYVVAEELRRDPEVDLIFTDEDKVDETGVRYDPWFKPDWNYDLMLSQNAVVHLAVFRRSIINDIGGLRSGFDGSQDYDLVLRFSERIPSKRIRHIPFILYHWRAVPGSVALAEGEKAYAYDAAERALREHLARQGVTAEVEKQSHPGYYRVRWPLPAQQPRVSIIIPTRDKVDLLRTAIGSIRALTSYDDYEIVVVDNCSVEKRTQQYLQEIGDDPRVRVLKYDRPYSYAALNNWAAAQTDSPLIAFLNNDIEVISSEWLSEMAAHALRPKVGAVGAKLLYPDKTLQHAGVVVGIGNRAGHPHVRLPRDCAGYFGRAVCVQQFSAVTAACMVMRRDVFFEMGGFDEEHFSIAFNDVDLGLRLTKAGYSVVWTPYAELVHHESATLGSSGNPERRALFELESANLQRIWAKYLDNDPFYNPNLTIHGGDFSPAFPPRVRRPWRFH